ncbi:MAG: hypothetical protein RL266_525 [Bacteroidota bacterium]|jgi:hypothetical protein
MRSASLVIWLLFATALSGCKLIDELRTFNLNYTVDFTVPSTTIIDLPLNLPTPSVTTNSEQRFENEGVESAWIESVKLIGLTCTITAPAGEDFSFLESISIYMNATGQPEVLIANLEPVPATADNSITLEVTRVDLYPYISQNSFSLRTSVTTDESMTQNIDIAANLIIEVKATIPGGK